MYTHTYQYIYICITIISANILNIEKKTQMNTINFFFFFLQKNQNKIQKHEINQKSEKTVLKYMYLDGFEIFFWKFLSITIFLTFVQNYFGSKNTFLEIFQKYRF